MQVKEKNRQKIEHFNISFKEGDCFFGRQMGKFQIAT
jgi:hypothetical protein